MTINVQSGKARTLPSGAASATERAALLVEVDFKWLMAGQGWWVDTTRFHTDPVYAARFLGSALASQCAALRNCAACLKSLTSPGVVTAE
ncbi:MAG: hypothetical protein RIS34_2538 [Pseudomonadota bacterium]|jgi:hypothetical protein